MGRYRVNQSKNEYSIFGREKGVFHKGNQRLKNILKHGKGSTIIK